MLAFSPITGIFLLTNFYYVLQFNLSIMETIFYGSLLLNAGLILLIIYWLFTGKTAFYTKKTKNEDLPAKTEPEISPVAAGHIVNETLHALSSACEEKLPLHFRGLIKILVECDKPELPAILQVGDLKISIMRNRDNLSVLEAQTPLEAICLARDGYDGTGRYITVPSELEYIIRHKDAINVYLRTLELEPISETANYWVVDVETGRNTGWKRFDWDVNVAYKRLKNKFKIRTPAGYRIPRDHQSAKLILLLKGWEHLFVEV